MTTATIVRCEHPASPETDAEGQRRQTRVLDELIIAGRSGDTARAHRLDAHGCRTSKGTSHSTAMSGGSWLSSGK